MAEALEMSTPPPTDELRAGDERHAVPSPPSFARNAFGRFTILLNVLGTALIIFMAIAVNGDILSRELFNQPIAGVTEFIALSIVAVVFLQMANTLRENRHVSNDMITAWIARKRPYVARIFYGVFYLIGAFLMVMIVRFVMPTFLENYYGGYYMGTTKVVEIPVWPFMLIVLIGAVTASVQYLLLAWQEFRQAFLDSGR
jgi:TRAP-type mannitol/chloroaromatic compound transport system permease small subunit